MRREIGRSPPGSAVRPSETAAEMRGGTQAGFFAKLFGR
jgi:hypothetical protein